MTQNFVASFALWVELDASILYCVSCDLLIVSVIGEQSARTEIQQTLRCTWYCTNKRFAVALNPCCYFISFHAPSYTHGFGARSALLSNRTHNALPAPCGSHCWKSVAIDI